MYNYRAKEFGFFGGTTYGPKEKRKVISVPEPLNPIPKWVEQITKEEPAPVAGSRKNKKASSVTADAADEATGSTTGETSFIDPIDTVTPEIL